MIDAYNELCTIQSVSSNHYYLIDALNAINVGGGGTSEIFELPALVQLGAKLNLLDRIKADSTIETADNSKFRELFSQLNDQFTALYNLTGI